MDIYVSDIKVTVLRKRIKNIHLYVKPPYGEVLLTAPLRTKDSEIEDFVNQKRDWIIKNHKKLSSSRVTPEPEFKTGEKIPIWGDVYTIYTLEGSKNSVQLKEIGPEDSPEFCAFLTFKPGSDVNSRRRFMTEWYRAELEERAGVIFPQMERYTGLKCSEWKTRVMKSRWGSCNVRTHSIVLNVKLAEYPTECLEYVILHELCHTVVDNHGAEFKALLSRYMPDWKEKKRWLKNEGF